MNTEKLTCDLFVERLYDGDSLLALRQEGPVPADVEAHVKACAACEAEWREAAEDLLRLPEELQVEVSPELRRKVLLRLEQTHGPQGSKGFDWLGLATWSGAGLALAGLIWSQVNMAWIPLGLVALSFGAGVGAAARLLTHSLSRRLA